MASIKKIRPVLSYTLLCDDVRQELGGKFSLMGLFETIYAGSFPAIHPRFAIVNEWTGGKGEFLARIRLLGPDKEQVLSESESKLVLYSETQRHRDIAVRFNTAFPGPGTYWVEILLDNERISLVSLAVQQAGQQHELVH
jgi:hypothetical protein